MKPDTVSTYSMTSSEGTRTSMSRVTRWSSVQALALASLAFICTAVFAVAALPGPDGGGDPTVGTLPMLGKSEGDFLDQTLTLRVSARTSRQRSSTSVATERSRRSTWATIVHGSVTTVTFRLSSTWLRWPTSKSRSSRGSRDAVSPMPWARPTALGPSEG